MNYIYHIFFNINIVYIKYFFVFVVEVTFLDFFYSRNLCYFHSFLYSVKKKSEKVFIVIVGIHAVTIYFFFVFIDLINDCKKT